ncbi:MAG: TolC family protein [Phycisphaerae bacterium]|nr:TolC family protein [Phycisphaerae bacterium]
MNRRLGLALAWTAATLSLILVLAGCRTHSQRYGLHELGVAPQQVHEIEPLEFKKAEPNEAPPEPNRPPEKVELSLPESRALALENNLQLKTALISPAIAGAQLSAEEAKFESSFFASANYIQSDLPRGGAVPIPGTTTLLPIVQSSQTDRLAEDLGVRVPLRTGGTVTFDLADARTEIMYTSAPFNPSFENTATVSLSQPLLRNAGQWVNTYSIRVAAYNRDITDTRTKLEVINVLAAMDRVYWRLYAARRELQVRQQQYNLAQAQLDRARRLVEAGQRSQVEIIRAEAGVADQLQAIIVAENSLRDRERELKRVVHKAGLDMQTPTIVIPTTEPDPVRYQLERPRLVSMAIENRMELLELQLQLLQDASAIDYARNQTLPLVSLDYTYNINSTGESRNESFDMLVGSDYTNHRVGLQVTIPLGNEAAKNRLRQSLYTRRQRLATRANREDLIRQEVLNAVDQVEANWQQILAARQTSILNGRLFEAEQRQFDQGLRTSTDVLDAQIRFANAQSSEIAALANYQISLVDVAYATGTLLGSAKVEWEPIVPATDVE